MSAAAEVVEIVAPGYEATPKGIPEATVKRLEQAREAVLRAPKVAEKAALARAAEDRLRTLQRAADALHHKAAELQGESESARNEVIDRLIENFGNSAKPKAVNSAKLADLERDAGLVQQACERIRRMDAVQAEIAHHLAHGDFFAAASQEYKRRHEAHFAETVSLAKAVTEHEGVLPIRVQGSFGDLLTQQAEALARQAGSEWRKAEELQAAQSRIALLGR